MAREEKRGNRWWIGVFYVVFLFALAEGVLLAYEASTPPSAPFAERHVYRYVPYVEHVMLERDDQQTLETTPAYGAVDGAPDLWVFGGSTAYGRFNTDDQPSCEPVVPCQLSSHLAAQLAEAGTPYNVFNFGQPNYASTQERILFSELLRERPTPAVAIFYDGVNDSESIANIPGYPNEYPKLRRLVEGGIITSNFHLGVEQSRVRTLFALDWLANSRRESEELPTAPWRTGPVDPERFQEEVAAIYAHNVRLIDAACEDFGITCFYVWQPWLRYKPELAPEEQSLPDIYGMGPVDLVGEIVVELPTIRANPRFFSVQDVFRGVSEAVFADSVHIDESTEGHAIIARAIIDGMRATGWTP